MKKPLIICTTLFLAACTTATHYDALGHKVNNISCSDTVQNCYAKAAKICTAGYAIIKENPPIPTGNYYANPYETTTNEIMAYTIIVSCK